MHPRYRYLSLLLLLVVGWIPQTEAQLFQQTFSTPAGPLQGTSTSPVFLSDPTYVSLTPTNAQFTSICATSGGTPATQYVVITMDGSVLTIDRVGGGNGALTRNLPFAGPPTSLLVKFDFNVTSYRRSGGGTANNYVNFNVGTSYDSSANRPSGGYAKFGIGFYRVTGTDSNWYVNNINAGTTPGPGRYLGWQTITFAVNGTGSTGSYTSPGGVLETIADQTWDLWVGTTKEFDDQPVLDNTQAMSAFKLVFGSGSNTVAFDNLQIDPLIVVGVAGDPLLPRQTVLEPNYPNPFNPSTRLTLRLGSRERARVKVFDLMGREVATLVDEVKEAGTYALQFDGTGLPSGVYLCRLQAGPVSQVRKLVLMK